jgi:ribose 1,5-bisphosphokinase PhnN
VLEQRLRMRGREFGADQQARLVRGDVLDRGIEADIRIENNGAVEAAVSALMDALMPLAAREPLSA